MGTPKHPGGAGVDTLGAVSIADPKPPPKGYSQRWYPPNGVDPCNRCGNRPAFLAHSLKTGKLLGFEESGMPHPAVCPGRKPRQRRWWAEEADR
jgi:hypothetical protein